MKRILLVLLVLSTLNGFSQDYLLADKNADKTLIADFIKKSIRKKKLKKNPVLVLNQKVLKNEELNQFQFYSSDILDISVINKGNKKVVDTYGKQGLNGVVLILTKPSQDYVAKDKILLFVNGKKVTQAELKELNPYQILSIDVIKDKEGIAQYTSEDYDGIVVIKLKE